MSSSAPTHGEDSRSTGIAGLVAFVLLFTPIIAISTQGEPSFTTTAGEAYTFLMNGGDVGRRNLPNTSLVLAALVLLWFTWVWACCSPAPRAGRPGGR